MDLALRIAKRGYGTTSPNPMVGAVLVKGGQLIGKGWHRQAGSAHAEIEALQDARAAGHQVAGATLYVTLEPCSTHGRTPPCTDAIAASGITSVVTGATDPNPKHAGRGCDRLRAAGIEVVTGIREAEAALLNEAFNHWIVRRTPFVTVKAAMSLDGKIATSRGESRWITGARARAYAMRMRRGSDAILVGINTVLRDDPCLTARRGNTETARSLRRIIVDSEARTPLSAQVVSDARRDWTTVVVSERAVPGRIEALAQRARVLMAPSENGRIDLPWLLDRLGAEDVTSLLVEGGGEVNASFLLSGLAHRIAFFYAPKILGGRAAPAGVGGPGIALLADAPALRDLEWRRLEPDFLLTARVAPPQARPVRG